MVAFGFGAGSIACDGGRLAPSDATIGGDGTPGGSCTGPADCPDGRCIPSYDGVHLECAHACPDSSGVLDPSTVCGPLCGPSNACALDWACASIGGAPGVCICTPSDETCDGRDNDCNGIPDDPAATDPECVAAHGAGAGCEAGECVACPERCGGHCTSTEDDVHNCGSCGHACPGADDGTGICVEHTCELVEKVASPTSIYTPYLIGFAVDGDTLAWAFAAMSTNAAQRCTIGNCAATTTALEPSYALVSSIAAQGGEIYWTKESELYHCPTSGCATAPTGLTMSANNFPVSLAVSATQVWVGAAGSGFVLAHCDRANCAGTKVVDAITRRPQALAIDDARLWIGTGDQFSSVLGLQTCPLSDCTSPADVLPAQNDTISAFPASPEGGVYSAYTSPNGIWYRGVDDATPHEITPTREGTSPIAVDGTTVYTRIRQLVGSEYRDFIASCPIAGCVTPRPIYQLPDEVFGHMHLAGNYLYWSSYKTIAGGDPVTSIYRIRVRH